MPTATMPAKPNAHPAAPTPEMVATDGASAKAAAMPSLPQLQRLVLTGFMGAGKSTVGRLVAERMSWRFIDVDQLIEARAGMSVAEIFAKLGEFVFRRMETSAIAHALGERRAVIALGGGAPEVLANRLLLEQTPHTAVVLLEAPLETLFERCDAQAAGATEIALDGTRPVLQDRSAAESRFNYRAPLYRRIARRTVATAGQSPEETTQAVLAAAGLAETVLPR